MEAVYIHIPFCVRKCPYCDFTSFTVGESEPPIAEKYISAVCVELQNYLAESEGQKISTVFFGGGTPSLLNSSRFKSILSVIRDNSNLAVDAEITLEANPGTVLEQLGREKLDAFRALGINRISFGSQSFSNRKLKALGRYHTPEDIHCAVSNAREAGFKRLNLDLIFGVINEDSTEWETDLDTALSLSPDHISAYGLTIEPGTEFGRLSREGVINSVSDDVQGDFFEFCQQKLSNAGFKQYEISNYAKDNEECRHNLNYWRRGDYLGIGAGAHGFSQRQSTFGKRWMNMPGVDRYISKVECDGKGIISEEMVTKSEAETEYISLSLRTSDGMSIRKYEKMFDQNFHEKYGARVQEFIGDNLLVGTGEMVRVTGKGFVLLNSIVEKFVQLILVLLVVNGLTSSAIAEDSPDKLPAVVVTGAVPRVAIPESISTISTLASPLRYEPYVDLQERGTPEGQGDLVIRGGTFENTAVSLGALSIIDPQTGHYVLELPLSPEFFSSPEIFTGSEQSIRGLNSSVGSVGFEFLPIKESELKLRMGAGENEFNSQSVFVRKAHALGEVASNVGVDLEYSRSRTDGTVRNGGSRFDRVSARFQLDSEIGQTDLFGGFQHKFLSWPDLYALQELHTTIGSSGIESDELRTGMVGLHHTVKFDDQGSEFKAGILYRENRDDYELDRFNIGLFNPFRHNTKVVTAAVEGTVVCDYFRVRSSARVMGDWLNSTALTFLSYDNRVIGQVALVPELVLPVFEKSELVLSAGVRYDETDRTDGKILPVTGVSLKHAESEKNWERVFVDFSGASQVAGYTALASNSAAGLFRGNPDLDQTVSLNSEIGAELARENFQTRASFFIRNDNDLVDWVYSSSIQPFAPRSAANVDIVTVGLEYLIRAQFDALTTVFSYALLNKEKDYGDQPVDASFYALNYPNHRFTAAASYAFTDFLRLRSDNELRIQEPNSLRASSDRSYLISSLSLVVDVPVVVGLSVEGVVDNIGDENFEEVPGVPGRRRFAGGYVNYRW